MEMEVEEQVNSLWWAAHKRELVNRLYTFQELDIGTDFELKAQPDESSNTDNHSVKVHRLILSIFCSSLTHYKAESYSVNVSKDDLYVLVEFLYTGRLNIHHKQLKNVLKAAQTLGFKVLEDIIAKFVGISDEKPNQNDEQNTSEENFEVKKEPIDEEEEIDNEMSENLAINLDQSIEMVEVKPDINYETNDDRKQDSEVETADDSEPKRVVLVDLGQILSLKNDAEQHSGHSDTSRQDEAKDLDCSETHLKICQPNCECRDCLEHVWNLDDASRTDLGSLGTNPDSKVELNNSEETPKGRTKLRSLTRHQNKVLCDICGIEFTRQTINRHRIVHQSGFECHLCGFTLHKREKLLRHLTQIHVLSSQEAVDVINLKFSSDQKKPNGCKKRTKRSKGCQPKKLLVPMVTYKCEKCNITCRSKSQFVTHKWSHDKVECEICGLEFSINFLEMHRELHKPSNKRQEYLCHLCGFAFKAKVKLEGHLINVHVLTKDEATKIVKNLSFQQTSNLARCTFCTFQGDGRATMQNHVKSCHQQTFYYCRLCPFYTKTVNKLKRHSLTCGQPKSKSNKIKLDKWKTYP
ncbi:hypothetical protein CHUAL_012105 [Chamberlinius hualienensis]